MISWILVIALAAAWGGTQLGIRPTAWVLGTSLKVPTSLLVSPVTWHTHFCDVRPGHVCREVEPLTLTAAQLRELVHPGTLLRAQQRANSHMARMEGFTSEREATKAVYLTCCNSDATKAFGIVLGSSADHLVVFEPSHDIAALTIVIVARRHCVTPPMLPFGVATRQSSRASSRWPDHWHCWLEGAPGDTAVVAANSVAIWSAFEVAASPSTSYDIITAVKRLVTPLPMYVFDDAALRLSRLGQSASDSLATLQDLDEATLKKYLSGVKVVSDALQVSFAEQLEATRQIVTEFNDSLKTLQNDAIVTPFSDEVKEALYEVWVEMRQEDTLVANVTPQQLSTLAGELKAYTKRKVDEVVTGLTATLDANSTSIRRILDERIEAANEVAASTEGIRSSIVKLENLVASPADVQTLILTALSAPDAADWSEVPEDKKGTFGQAVLDDHAVYTQEDMEAWQTHIRGIAAQVGFDMDGAVNSDSPED